MAGFGQIGYSQANKLANISGAIWGDCPSQDLLVADQGYAVYKDFKDRLPQTADGASVTWITGTSAAVIWNLAFDSVIKLTSGSTQSNDAGIATRPLGPVIPGSGQKIWFEALVSLASLAAAQGVYVGLVNKAGLGTGLTISAASGTKNANTLGTSSGGQSGYGFWMHGDTLGNFDAVWFNNLQSATGATDLEATTATVSGLVLANVLTANANNPNPANLAFTPPVPPGVLTATVITNQTVAGQSLTPQQLLDLADPSTQPPTLFPNNATGNPEFVKLGLRYDGFQYLYFYVNGSPVAKMLISSAQDITSNFAGIVTISSGTAAVESLNIGFVHAASLRVP